MQEMGDWLTDYTESHRDVNHATVYWASVLSLVVATVGLLWSLPVPAEFARISPILNWGSAFLMAATVYYFIISMSLAIGMLPFVFGVALSQIWLLDSQWSLARVSTGLLSLSLLGICLGRANNGGIRAVIRDIQLMMIAPIWMLSKLYKRASIPY